MSKTPPSSGHDHHHALSPHSHAAHPISASDALNKAELDAIEAQKEKAAIGARNHHLESLYKEAAEGHHPSAKTLAPDEAHALQAGEKAHARWEREQALHPHLIADARVAASIASLFPGPGGIAAAATDFGATMAELHNNIAEGVSKGKTIEDSAKGLADVVFDAIPFGGGVALKVAFGIAGTSLSGRGCKTVQDTRNLVVPESDANPCINFEDRAEAYVLQQSKDALKPAQSADSIPPATPPVTPNAILAMTGRRHS